VPVTAECRSHLPLQLAECRTATTWWNENLDRLRRETRKERKKWILCAPSEKIRYRSTCNTDGSVISECTGYGLVICSDTGIVVTCRGKLPNACSISQAGGQAILQGLRFATEMSPPPKSIEIFSDSRVALISSLSSERITSPFLEIRKLQFAMYNKVQRIWIAKATKVTRSRTDSQSKAL
jgi:Reverse transcriptase-like